MTADMVFSEFIFQLLKVYAILSFARRVLMCYSLKELLRLRLVRQTLGTGDTRTFLKRVIQQPFIYIKKNIMPRQEATVTASSHVLLLNVSFNFKGHSFCDRKVQV